MFVELALSCSGNSHEKIVSRINSTNTLCSRLSLHLHFLLTHSLAGESQVLPKRVLQVEEQLAVRASSWARTTAPLNLSSTILMRHATASWVTSVLLGLAECTFASVLERVLILEDSVMIPQTTFRSNAKSSRAVRTGLSIDPSIYACIDVSVYLSICQSLYA